MSGDMRLDGGSAGRSQRWPCLIYHEVPSAAPVGYFAVASERFASQLDLMRRLDLAVTSMEEARPGGVALTFDDGHVSHYAVAFPMLLPFLARKPSTVTTSPAFIEFRVQPALKSPFGPPISMPQFVTFPVSSLTSR